MPITIAQLTDTHLLADRDDRLRGCPTWHTLQAVLHQVAQSQPDYLLLTGDLADQGSVEAYGHLLDLITPLKIPTYWIPGNHDRLDVMQTALNHPLLNELDLAGSGSISLGDWRLLLLNSVLPTGQFGEGFLGANTLDWLVDELNGHLDQSILIALHHHPVPTQIDWLDQMQVQNSDLFLRLLDRFPQVQVVVFGHIHMALHHEYSRFHGNQEQENVPPPKAGEHSCTELVRKPLYTTPTGSEHENNNRDYWNTIDFYGCPSTCLQVLPQTAWQDITSQQHQPGFRLLYLHADGSHDTQIQRVAIDVADS